MHLTPGSQVCFGCGLPLGAEATPLAAPAIEAVSPPVLQAPDNPWRTTAPATVEETAPVAQQPAAPVEQPAAAEAPEQEAVAEAASTGFAERSQAVVAADLATPAVRGPLLAFDPLPPVAASANEDPYVTATVEAPAAPAIPVEEVDGAGTIRGHAHSTEQTLAVPAAYATFAPEATQDVAAYRPDAGVADVVALDFPAVLTVAPPQAPVTSWPDADTQRRVAEAQ
jgi:ribonuclease E